MSRSGFAYGKMLVFCMVLIAAAVSAQAQTYKVLYTFGNVSLDPDRAGWH